jgi:hypothetical protein
MRKMLIALAGGALVVTLAAPAGASTAEPQRGGPAQIQAGPDVGIGVGSPDVGIGVGSPDVGIGVGSPDLGGGYQGGGGYHGGCGGQGNRGGYWDGGRHGR